MNMLDLLQRRHQRIESEIKAEQSRVMPDDLRISKLKRLKLALKDRMLMAREARERREPAGQRA